MIYLTTFTILTRVVGSGHVTEVSHSVGQYI